MRDQGTRSGKTAWMAAQIKIRLAQGGRVAVWTLDGLVDARQWLAERGLA